MKQVEKPNFKDLTNLQTGMARADADLSGLTVKRSLEIDAIQKAGREMKRSQAVAALKKIPVSELSRSKSGIRVAALEKKGYTTLGDLYDVSQRRLESIDGIGEKQARAIKDNMIVFVRQMEKETPIRLSLDDTSAENMNLMRSVYAYRQAIGLREDAASLYGETHPQIQDALAHIKVKNGFSWVFAKFQDKADTDQAFRTLAALAEDGYYQKVVSLTGRYKALSKTDDETVRKDFEQNSATYYAILEEMGITEEASSSGETTNLPEELAQAVREETLDDSYLKVTLRNYQTFGVQYILHQKKVLLGDEMGLGKTIMAIASMAVLAATEQATHFLVVAPASVLVNWCREIEKWSTLKTFLIHGDDEDIAQEDWVLQGGVAVTNYESTADFIERLGLNTEAGTEEASGTEITSGDAAMDRLTVDSEESAAYKEAKKNLKVSMLVIDEAHYIKNPEAKRTQNLVKIGELTDRILMMTGTPLENKVDEMCNLVDYLRPDMSKEVRENAFMTEAPQFKRLVSPVYLRRVREDVLSELPEITEKEEWCTMTEEDKKAYKKQVWAESFMSMRRVSFLQDDMTTSSKMERLKELVSLAAGENRKVLVFSFYRDTIAKVKATLGDQAMGPISGDTPINKRQEIIDEFTQSEEPKVLVSQVQAGGTGLNIQTASVVIFCEPQIKPSLETQAISRVYRMGQVRNVLVYRLLCEKTIDEQMLILLSDKQEIFDQFAQESEMAEADERLSQTDWMREVIKEEKEKYPEEI